MTICFLFALEHEANYLVKHSKVLGEERFGFAHLYHLENEGHEFFACVSGVGKVLAGSAAAECCALHPEIDAFVNLGIGGSLNAEKAPLLSAVIGKDFVQHDMDTSALGDPYGHLFGLNRIRIEGDERLNGFLQKSCAKVGCSSFFGTIASGDHFIADDASKKIVIDRFDAILIDMETAAFAEACFVHGKPFTALRVISDAVDHNTEYMTYRFPAGEKACQIGLGLLALC